MPHGFSYSCMAPASAKALKNETTAKSLFETALKQFDKKQKKKLKPGETHCISPLLTPNIHLTSHTYGTFHRWVKENHEGWKCKRREATREECKEHGAYNRGKSYYVDAIYEAPDPVKQKRLLLAAEKRAAKKAKLEARRDPSTIFGKLGEELQIKVISFIEDDVPRLQALLATPFKELAQRDEFWQDKLKSLLEEKFDDAFEVSLADSIAPLSKRPNWTQSTEFRTWYNECLQVQEPIKYLDSVMADTVDQANEWANAGAHLEPVPQELEWLLQNVSTCEYFLHAKAYAEQGEQEMHIQRCDDTNRCYGCFEKWHSCRCR